MALLPENDILLRLNAAAKTAGVRLSYSNKIFFLRLLDAAECRNGIYRTFLTVNEFSESFNMPKRTVVDSLRRLSACNAIVRRPRTKPQFTRLNKSIIELEDG